MFKSQRLHFYMPSYVFFIRDSLKTVRYCLRKNYSLLFYKNIRFPRLSSLIRPLTETTTLMFHPFDWLIILGKGSFKEKMSHRKRNTDFDSTSECKITI